MAAEQRTTSSTGGQKGVKLARFELIPAGPHRELAEHYGRGARKYANHQWRQGYEWSKSIGALERHLNDFKAGKDYDVCSNEPDNCAVKIDDGTEGGTLLPYNALEAQYILDGGTVTFRYDGFVFPLYDPANFELDTCFNHTGSHHMVAVAWHAFLLLEFKDTHPDHDDRYKVKEKFLDSFDVTSVAKANENLSEAWLAEDSAPHHVDRIFRVES